MKMLQVFLHNDHKTLIEFARETGFEGIPNDDE